MNVDVVNNEIFIYDIGIKKNSWCSLHFKDMVNGLYGIKEKDGKYFLISKRYRKIRKNWEITDDEFGIDNQVIFIESGKNKTEIDLSEYNIEKNAVLSVEVCRNSEGLIFGISWKV